MLGELAKVVDARGLLVAVGDSWSSSRYSDPLSDLGARLGLETAALGEREATACRLATHARSAALDGVRRASFVLLTAGINDLRAPQEKISSLQAQPDFSSEPGAPLPLVLQGCLLAYIVRLFDANPSMQLAQFGYDLLCGREFSALEARVCSGAQQRHVRLRPFPALHEQWLFMLENKADWPRDWLGAALRFILRLGGPLDGTLANPTLLGGRVLPSRPLCYGQLLARLQRDLEQLQRVIAFLIKGQGAARGADTATTPVTEVAVGSLRGLGEPTRPVAWG